MVVCKYKNICSGYPYMCDTCRNNKSKKRNYYIPGIPYIPDPKIRWCYPASFDDSLKTVHIHSNKTKVKKKNYYKKK